MASRSWPVLATSGPGGSCGRSMIYSMPAWHCMPPAQRSCARAQSVQALATGSGTASGATSRSLAEPAGKVPPVKGFHGFLHHAPPVGPIGEGRRDLVPTTGHRPFRMPG